MKIKSVLNFFAITIFTVSYMSCNNSKTIANHNRGGIQAQMPLQETYWRLQSLMGQTIPHLDPVLQREAHIVFNKDGRAAGNGGCNNFGGSYQLNEPSQILFGPIMSTKMYCNDAQYENLFFDILNKAGNYFIKGDTLFLRNKQMDSIAKFIAVDLKK